MPTVTSALAALLTVTTLATAGCTATVTGDATRSAGGDDVDIAAMDTGVYPTTAGSPFGTAGDDREDSGLLEAHRLGAFVVGPWQVEGPLRARGDITQTSVTGPIPSAEQLGRQQIFADPLPAIASEHGFLAGFSSYRVSVPESGPLRGLQNTVLRFPDPVTAAAAAAQMAAANPPPVGTTGVPTSIDFHPDALATRYQIGEQAFSAQSFSAHGSYVLYQKATATSEFLSATPELMISEDLTSQLRMIDQFDPTPPDQLSALPKDPSGQLLAKALWSQDNRAPFVIGVWKPKAWVHFEDDPVEATALFGDAEVEMVAQRLATVYQTRSTRGAARIVERFAEDMRTTPGVTNIGEVPGLPGAKCFARDEPALPATATASWLRIDWHFKCVAAADRYAFTVFSERAEDVMQQVSAQYRILAGR